MSFGDAIRKAMDSELIEPPKGQYKVKLESAEAWEMNDGRQFAKIILTITDGELAGQQFQHFMGFASELPRQINGETLAALGVNMTEVEEVSDLDDQLGALVKMGTTADVGVSYTRSGDRDFINLKVHGSRTAGVSDIPTDNGPEQKPAASFAAAAKSDDVPF